MDSIKVLNISSSVSLNATAADIAVFVCLECFAVMAIIGNSLLVCVILRNKYLDKPSFILIFSLGLADILHGIVTSTYFYPPILLRYNHFPETAYRLMNVIDWTAWGITISHMAAIGIDRLLAIVLYHKYPQIMTVWRTKAYSLLFWCLFFCTNGIFYVTNVCCPIVPMPEYYTFDYQYPQVRTTVIGATSNSSNTEVLNIYRYIYTPLEVTVLIILAISNPITLIRLYQKYRKKRTLQLATRMLINMACRKRGGQKVLQVVNRNQQFLNRDVRIFIQISTVTVIFFCYMFIYYLFFYVVKMTDKWSTMFNSFFYSTTHMINPIIYFSLNLEMRSQLKSLFCCFSPTQNLRKSSQYNSNDIGECQHLLAHTPDIRYNTKGPAKSLKAQVSPEPTREVSKVLDSVKSEQSSMENCTIIKNPDTTSSSSIRSSDHTDHDKLDPLCIITTTRTRSSSTAPASSSIRGHRSRFNFRSQSSGDCSLFDEIWGPFENQTSFILGDAELLLDNDEVYL